MNGSDILVSRKFISVLLVEDDEFTRDLVVHMLHKLGVTDIATAPDGTKGIAAFDVAKVKPDLILCDIYMPGLDGFEFMVLLAKRAFKGGIILISGMDASTLKSASFMARFHKLNILATLEKPISKSALANAIAKLS